MSDTQFLLGKLVEGDPGRDAVHIAVAPATARTALDPGEQVGIFPNGEAGTARNPIGIVDPFLKNTVKQGQRFWIFLFPNTITSLKHLWTHPAFEAEPQREPAKSASEQWMRAWALMHMSDDYYGDGGKRSAEVAYADAIEAGRSHNVGPYEDARDHINDEWWSHWEAITGEAADRENYFRCAC